MKIAAVIVTLIEADIHLHFVSCPVIELLRLTGDRRQRILPKQAPYPQAKSCSGLAPGFPLPAGVDKVEGKRSYRRFPTLPSRPPMAVA